MTIYGTELDSIFGRGPARGGGGRMVARPHPPRPVRRPASSSSSSSSSGWPYPASAWDGGGSSGGGGIDVEGIANQVVADLMQTGTAMPTGPTTPVSFGEDGGEPQFGSVVPTAALPNSAQNRLAQARYVERMREGIRDRSEYLQAMDGAPIPAIFEETIIERDRPPAVADDPRYGARYGFSCSVPARGERMGALDVQTDVTRPSRIPPEFFGGVPAPMVPSHAAYGAMPAPMVPSHAAYGAMPAPMVPSHAAYGMAYGEDSARPASSPFMDALKIGMGVGLGVTAVVVGVNLLGRAMR
jgi:hypothetical protein